MREHGCVEGVAGSIRGPAVEIRHPPCHLRDLLLAALSALRRNGPDTR